MVVYIETPEHLNKETEELLRKLAELEGSNVTPKKKGFFARRTKRLTPCRAERSRLTDRWSGALKDIDFLAPGMLKISGC